MPQAVFGSCSSDSAALLLTRRSGMKRRSSLTVTPLLSLNGSPLSVRCCCRRSVTLTRLLSSIFSPKVFLCRFSGSWLLMAMQTS